MEKIERKEIFKGLSHDKGGLFSEMKVQIRTCSIPSLAPTSRFKKKTRRFQPASKAPKRSFKTLLDQSGASSQGGLKSILKMKKAEMRSLGALLPEGLKFYAEFLGLGFDFDGSKHLFKEIKKSKIRSTFGGADKVDQKLEENMGKMYGTVHRLSAICKCFILPALRTFS